MSARSSVRLGIHVVTTVIVYMCVQSMTILPTCTLYVHMYTCTHVCTCIYMYVQCTCTCIYHPNIPLHVPLFRSQIFRVRNFRVKIFSFTRGLAPYNVAIARNIRVKIFLSTCSRRKYFNDEKIANYGICTYNIVVFTQLKCNCIHM